MKVLTFALKEDALYEYNQNLQDEVYDGVFRNVEGLILAISRRLETSELKMEKNLWSFMTLSSVHVEREFLQKSLSCLKKSARKLQSRLGGDFKSDNIIFRLLPPSTTGRVILDVCR